MATAFGPGPVEVRSDVPGAVPVPGLWPDRYLIVLKSGVRVYLAADEWDYADKTSGTLQFFRRGLPVARFAGAEVAGLIEAVRPKDMAGKTALECCRMILEERDNRSIHFDAAAREALKRGYEGRAVGSREQIESITGTSFWAALSRSDDFECVGNRLYRLARRDGTDESGSGRDGDGTLYPDADQAATLPGGGP